MAFIIFFFFLKSLKKLKKLELSPQIFRYDVLHLLYSDCMFVSFLFRFSFFISFGDKVTKILRNLCLHFARQDGQDRKKNQKKNYATKVTKIPKNSRRKYGMNETIIEKMGSFMTTFTHSFFSLTSKLCIPSTLKIDIILWLKQLIVCAVKC